ncbi:pyridoxal phosphate-dependent aminotransferase [Peribacillus muralis]|uniref:MalY/PatB family protein n=1 Tax=Peribacillus muralis TaxID=264697 RepID=UPI001F4D4B50|nr:MalY/PatB family protein [Peribacillus muralis]MCK1993666.1 pyridoxal phosphate-dependent aminotransferase [Peribacillus muralis]MCK2014046.1 pyridoxal phosphate-dependent aminotransferase [Peribacillus muralis]
MQHDFNEKIDRRGTFCTQWDYVQDRFGEKDLLPFSISDTDFKSPPEILQAIQQRLQHGIFGYTRWNHSPFKDAITQWYKKRFVCPIQEDWITYSPSVIYSVSKLIEIMTEEEDQVVIQTPAYDAFFKTIQDNKRIISSNELIYHEGAYSIDFSDLEEKLAHPKAKVLLLCSPHNPTGRVWTRDELNKIVALCNRYDVYIISDEIHMDIIHEENTHTPIVQSAIDPNTLCICSSASKTFNTPGLGGSYCLIPDTDIREAFLISLKNKDGLSSASVFGMEAVITAYTQCEYWVDELVEYVYGNLRIIQLFLKEHLPMLSFHLPESTYLAWIDVSQLPYSSNQIQDALVHQGKVAIMPGVTFGESGSCFIRLNVGCPEAKLQEGLDRLKSAIAYLENQEI